MKIAVTGAKGLLGWHTAGRLHAGNCAARYAGQPDVHDLVLLDRADFSHASSLSAKLEGVDAILHFAGINRGESDIVANGNPDIASALVAACKRTGVKPHIVYANSTHAALDTVYGNSKRLAGEILRDFAGSSYADIILPHIFGECARPYYNNVTATLIDNLWSGTEPRLEPDGRVRLLHAGSAAELAIDTALKGSFGRFEPDGRDIGVTELFDRLQHFHTLYNQQIFPDLGDPFDLALFNCLRTGAFPKYFPRPVKVNSDHRGTLFESAKGGNASHTFLSTTFPGKTRGDHFHIDLVERFLVVAGEAVIRIRKILTDEVYEFPVNGQTPAAIDMPPMHTHHIENTGGAELVTFFWSHRVFDPARPDTFAEPVRIAA